MDILKTFLIVALILICTSISAQKHYVGLTGQYAWNFLISKDFPIETNSLTTYNYGLTYDYQGEKGINFSADFIYATKGFSTQIIFTDQTGVEIGEYKIPYEYQYFSIPIKIGGINDFTRGNLRAFYNIGLVPSYLDQTKIKYPDVDGIENIELSSEDKIDNFNLNLTGEIGLEIVQLEKLILDVSFVYEGSIINLANDEYFSSSNMFLQSTSLNLGMKYPLN